MNNNMKHQKHGFNEKSIAILFSMALLLPILAKADLNNGLVAYYPFNGNANDESGNGNYGTVNGATLTTDGNGKPNSAYNFNGTGDYIGLLNYFPSPVNNTFTFSAWIKPSSCEINTDGSIIGSTRWTWGKVVFSLRTVSGECRIHSAEYGIQPSQSTGPVGSEFYGNTAIQLNQLQHVVWVMNGDTGTSYLYVNGILDTNTTFSVVNNTAVDFSDLNIGAFLLNRDARFYAGLIDSVRIYNRTLSDTEVMEMYKAKDQFTINATPLLSLGDINKDNSPEIAVITYNPTLKKSTATVKNARTGGLVKQITFNGQFVPTKANVLPDLNGNGASEIAVLGVRSSDQAVQVEVRDSLSGVKLSAMPFDPAFKPLDLGVVRDISGKGTAGLAVLQQNATQLRVQLKNALTGAQIRNISFNANYNGIDLLVISDLNANQSREIAVLADNKTTSAADIVEIHDSKTGALIRTISYGSGQELKQLINLPDLNNKGGPELGVLRTNTARVSLKDTLSGLPVNTLDYALSQPFKLASVADSNSQTHLAMLGLRASDGQIRAEVHDTLTDTFINKVVFDNYGTTVGFISIPDLNGNGVAELVRLREQPGPQKLFAEVRDGKTGVLIQGMYF